MVTEMEYLETKIRMTEEEKLTNKLRMLRKTLQKMKFKEADSPKLF